MCSFSQIKEHVRVVFSMRNGINLLIVYIHIDVIGIEKNIILKSYIKIHFLGKSLICVIPQSKTRHNQIHTMCIQQTCYCCNDYQISYFLFHGPPLLFP